MKRRKQLAPGKPLERRTRLKVGATIKRGKALRREGARGKSHRQRMDELRPLVFARDSWRCQAKAIGGFCDASLQAHHVLPSGQGGPDVLDNCLTVCTTHHLAIHGHPKQARALGFLIRRHDPPAVDGRGVAA